MFGIVPLFGLFLPAFSSIDITDSIGNFLILCFIFKELKWRMDVSVVKSLQKAGDDDCSASCVGTIQSGPFMLSCNI